MFNSIKNIIRQVYLHFAAKTFIKNLTLKNIVTHQNKKSWGKLSELTAFLLLKQRVKIPLQKKKKKNPTGFKFFYKFLLIITINIFSILMKLRLGFWLISIICCSLILPTYCIEVFSFLISPQFLKKHFIPTSQEILQYFNCSPFFEQLCLNYLFPFSGLCCCYFIFRLCTVNWVSSEQQYTNPIFETCLIYLLQIYTKDFLNDSQEEALDVIEEIDIDYQNSTAITTFFFLYLLWLHEIGETILHFRRAVIRQRDPATIDLPIWNFTQISSDLYTFWGKHQIQIPNPNSYFYKLHSRNFDNEEQPDDMGWDTEDFIDIFDNYFKGLIFSWSQYSTLWYTSVLWGFFILLIFIIIVIALIYPYRLYISKVYFEKMSYNYYRPYLDQYFYVWSRLLTKIPQYKQQFLIQDPYLSQYLDTLTFFEDMQDEEREYTFFERILNRPLNFGPLSFYHNMHPLLTEEYDTTESEINPDAFVPTNSIPFWRTIIFTPICLLGFSILLNPYLFYYLPLTFDFNYQLPFGKWIKTPNLTFTNFDKFYQLIKPYMHKYKKQRRFRADFPQNWNIIIYKTWLWPHTGFFNWAPLITISPNKELPWLLQKLHTSSLTWFLHWPGWFISKHFFSKIKIQQFESNNKTLYPMLNITTPKILFNTIKKHSKRQYSLIQVKIILNKLSFVNTSNTPIETQANITKNTAPFFTSYQQYLTRKPFWKKPD